jgi:arylsulfatase A-like enzyme
MNAQSRREFLLSAALGAAARGLTAADSDSPRPNRPNILLLFPDQHRFDWTGFNRDLEIETPNLDRLARRGIRFTQAIVASPLCAPSRACLASGKEYDRCRVPGNSIDYPIDQPTYYSLLRDAGYHVAGCGKLDLHKKTMDWGLDGQRLLKEWGFSQGIDNAGKYDALWSGSKEPRDPYMAYLYGRGLAAKHLEDLRTRFEAGSYPVITPTPLDEEAYCDNWVAAHGLSLLKGFPRNRPWHLAVNFTGPHDPEDVTGRMRKAVANRRYPQPNGCQKYTPETHVGIRQNYTAMVENIDRWVGQMIEEVRRRGELENTIIVYSSDHGEMLGDHDRWAKQVPYQASIGVPLILAGPGIVRGVTSEALVSIMDLAATFLDYGGVTPPADMDSRSFRSLLQGKAKTHREYLLCGLGPWRLAFDGRYKLIDGYNASVQEGAGRGKRFDAAIRSIPRMLFDRQHDALENRNIAQEAPNHVARLAELIG